MLYCADCRCVDMVQDEVLLPICPRYIANVAY